MRARSAGVTSEKGLPSSVIDWDMRSLRRIPF